MHVIIVYDINVDRVNQVNQLLKQYLNWVQNSVFTGNITKAKLEELKTKLTKIVNVAEDSVIIFILPSQKIVEMETLGKKIDTHPHII